MQLSLPACTRDKASRQALHKICSPTADLQAPDAPDEPPKRDYKNLGARQEREIRWRLTTLCQTYSFSVDNLLEDVFERECLWTLSADFVLKHKAALLEEGFYAADGSFIYHKFENQRAKEWQVFNLIFTCPYFSETTRIEIITNDPQIKLRQLLLIAAIIGREDRLYETVLEAIDNLLGKQYDT